MTQFNPLNRKYRTSIASFDNSVYLLIVNVGNPNSHRHIKNNKMLVGKIIKHRYSSSAPLVAMLEEWIETIDFNEVFAKAMAFPPETIFELEGVTIDFSHSPEVIFDRMFGHMVGGAMFANLAYRNIPDSLESTIPGIENLIDVGLQ